MTAVIEPVAAYPFQKDIERFLHGAEQRLHIRAQAVLYVGTCRTFGDRVRAGDTCAAAAKRNQITTQALLLNNRILANNCANLPRYQNYIICKSVVSPTTTAKTTAQPATTAAPAPVATTTTVDGIQDGTCVDRQNINTMQRSQPDVFNMLILALAQMQSSNTSNPLSFYQLGGIHGAPYVPWPNSKTTGGNRYVGYCTHTSGLFSSWHRPYMLLFERTLYDLAKGIANQFPASNRARYVAAAKNLRFPYWDWADATARGTLPAIVKQPTISVVTPTGTKTISNPFYTYKFKTGENSIFASSNTVKGATTVVRGSNAEAAIKQDFPSIGDGLYDALVSVSGYNNANRLIENVHNTIHNDVGGMMLVIDYSAFDPLFWLHHTNVDRVFAMWQAANPNVRMTNQVMKYDTFMRNAGMTDTATTPLYPFKHSNGAYWTSNDVASVRTMWNYGYGYPEVPCSRKSNTDTQLDAFTTSQINTKYQALNISPQSRVKRTSTDVTITKWNADIVIDVSELSGSYAIYIFWGEPPSDPAQWGCSDQRIGQMAIFGMDGRKMPSSIATGSVPLTPFLQQKGVTGNDTEIDNLLAANLVWKVYNNGQDVPVTSLPTLKIGVTNTQVVIPNDMTKKPRFGKLRLRPKVTRKKNCGVKVPTELSRPKLLDGQETTVPGALANITVASNSTQEVVTTTIWVRPSATPAPAPVPNPEPESLLGYYFF
ncbi:hypothetical protein H072_5928 [Dactylellina haptotyla CBS 200.50]|uniref:tyrosinase n=1 Tax=Dactylellina haptotyla (strain CBS 200.50) TaxID=1284197 RepID=S8AGJ7_DACHA|nr:hypothetical protein H072_5928 [Dactylellina haptotyla CBS 200.50]